MMCIYRTMNKDGIAGSGKQIEGATEKIVRAEEIFRNRSGPIKDSWVLQQRTGEILWFPGRQPVNGD